MNWYRQDPAALRALVRANAVHRDVYVDPEIFELEMERLWARTWIYVGHASQAPNPGDYITCTIANEPVLMVRQDDNSIRVLRNRCAHKGAKVVSGWSGNTGRFFRCPYHAWSFRTDGAIAAIPRPQGYQDTGFDQCEGAQGLSVVSSKDYRGFVFARLSEDGPDFQAYFGESLSSIDYMADRSPEGEMEVAGGVVRFAHDSHWKMFIENLNDLMHPPAAHASSAGTAKALWGDQPANTPKPMSIGQLVPFVESLDFFDGMGVRVFENGHSFTGTNFSIHSSYAAVPEYTDMMEQTYGAERAQDILTTVRHNTVYYPSLTIKGAIQTIRVVRPIAVNKTVIESWSFRLKGAPDTFLKRNVMYNRLINSPMSPVGHDDQECYSLIQDGLPPTAMTGSACTAITARMN